MNGKFLFKGVGNLVFTFMAFFIVSCVPIKNLKYISDINEVKDPIVNPEEQKLITPNDNLTIYAFSIDEKTNQVLSSMSRDAEAGYIVDREGSIIYPFVGRIMVAGLNPEEAANKLEQALNEYLSGVTLNIRFKTNYITSLGEFGSQGRFSFTEDKLNIYEAVALCGGINQYGDRKNLILIRQEGDKIMYHKLDLTTSKIAEREFYYIQNNDILIAEPLKAKSRSFNFQGLSLVFSVLSYASIFYTLFFRK